MTRFLLITALLLKPFTLLLAADEDPAPTLEALRGIWSAHFNHDASRVFTRTRTGAIGLWDANEGTPVPGDIAQQPTAVSHVMSRDGRFVFVAFKDEARVFDTTTGAAVSPPLKVSVSDGAEMHATFSRDNEAVVIFQPAEASIWRIRSGEKIAHLSGFKASENDLSDSAPSASFTPDGAWCFLHDGRGNVTRVETKTWQPVGKPCRHPAAESAYNFYVVVSEDGKWLATFDDPGENGPEANLQLWNALDAKPLGRPISAQNGFGVLFPTGTDRAVIAPARGPGQVRALPSLKSLYTIRRHDDIDGPETAVSPDGKWLLAWGSDRRLDLIEFATGKVVQTSAQNAKIERVFFAPDSAAVYVVYDNTAFLLQNHHDYYVVKMPLPALEIAGAIRVLDFLSRVSLSSDGRRILILQGGSDEERVTVHDTVTMRNE